MAANLETPLGILSFPNLFTARAPAPGSEPRFSINLLFDKQAQSTEKYREMRQAVARAIDEKWGAGKSKDAAFVAKLHLPFRSCEEKEYEGYKDLKDGVFINAWSTTKPGVVDADCIEITVPRDVYAGQYARATVSPFAYEVSGNKGVSFGLNNVQICRDGKRLDGRKAATDDFGKYTDPDAKKELATTEDPF